MGTQEDERTDAGHAGGEHSQLTRDVGALAAALRELAVDAAELAGLEGRRAVVAVMAMLSLAVGSAIVLAAAWFLLQASVAAWLVGMGYPLAATLGALAAVNALVALGLWWRLRQESRRLTFPETRQALREIRIRE